MQTDGGKDVLVTDQSWSWLESTRPGKARKLIRDGHAKLIEKEPPFIQLQRTVFKTNKEGTMVTTLVSLDKYFKENESIYVQNTSGGIVSLTFRSADGRPEPFSLPNDRRPIRLTDYVPKDMIVRSADFRKLVMRRPPAIKVLTEDEYSGKITTIAKESDKEPDAVVEEIAVKMATAQRKEIPVSDEFGMRVEEPGSAEEVMKASAGMDDLNIPGSVEDGVNPRVQQIVANCSAQAVGRIKAADALEDLENLNLTVEDLNFVIGSCSYKTVVSWAQRKLKEVKE